VQRGGTNISTALCLPGFPEPLQLSTENPKDCISGSVLVIYWGKVGARLLRCLYTCQSNHRLLHVKWLQKGLMVLEHMQLPQIHRESIPSMTGRKTSA